MIAEAPPEQRVTPAATRARRWHLYGPNPLRANAEAGRLRT